MILRGNFATNVDELKTLNTAVLRCANVGPFVIAGCENRCLDSASRAARPLRGVAFQLEFLQPFSGDRVGWLRETPALTPGLE